MALQDKYTMNIFYKWCLISVEADIMAAEFVHHKSKPGNETNQNALSE